MSMSKLQNKSLILFSLLIFGFVSLPLSVSAQTYRIFVSPEVKEVYKDDVFVMEIRISSPEQMINAIESVLLFDKDKLEVKELSTGGSLFVLWPQKPTFSNEDGKISFVAGTPDGFQGENALVLKIIFLAKNEGEAKLDFEDTTSFFLADGKGTQVTPWLKSLIVNILERPTEITPKDERQEIIIKDKNPPEPFEIKLAKDPFVFDNQYFISFFTTDRESGIAHYEVKEGDRDFAQAESPYLLKDQSLRSLIQVKAVDKAGNERIAQLMPPKKPFPWGIVILILVGLVIVIWWMIKKFLISK